ncbi:MAG: hypothetical protein J5776_03820 [Clostridiales bacterium]|nr:hypothetical protein [Clostridiales bacterium]
MTALISVAGTWTWYVICITALILCAGSLSVVFRCISDRRNKAPLIVALLNLTLITMVVIVLMDCGHCLHAYETNEYTLFQLSLFKTPYYVYTLLEILTCIIWLLLGLEGTSYRSKNITPDAIQQAIDALPEGVAISSEDGTVRLSNLRINNLSRTLTGKVLTNAREFWSYVTTEGSEQGGQFFIRNAGEAVWLFNKDTLTIDGTDYEQITAMNVTARYAIIRELEAKHEHLQDIQRRMREVSDLSGKMFIAQEEADARAALHNQLGQVLLMGRHYINHQDVTDPGVVYAATMQMNQFLLGEAQKPYEGSEDELSQSMSLANSIGVRVEMTGEEPADADTRKILAQAITECAANTVKHAEGDRIMIDISDAGIVITNNGKPPKGTIAESGGLLSLRRKIEAMGGTMLIESDPAFALHIQL